MNIVRWNPTADLLNVHQELDRVFNDLFSTSPVAARSGSGSAFLPIDITRTDNELVVEASVPGFSPDEVNVTVDSGILTIQARHEENQKTETKYLRQERWVGELYRQVQLGEGLDGENAAASFEHGVLRVTIPVVAKPEPKRIPIATNSK